MCEIATTGKFKLSNLATIHKLKIMYKAMSICTSRIINVNISWRVILATEFQQNCIKFLATNTVKSNWAT